MTPAGRTERARPGDRRTTVPLSTVAGHLGDSAHGRSDRGNESGVVEEPWILPRRPPLHGILTQRTAGSPRDMVVVLLNSGFLPRLGPHRMYVRLARRLASRGLHVLRFDYSGIGDSKVHAGHSRLEGDRVAETADVVEDLCVRLGFARVVLLGLCLSVDPAVAVALRDARVEGVVLVNGALLPGEHPAGPPRLRNRTYWRYYVSRIGDPKSWRRFLTGKTRYAGVRAAVAGRLRALWNRPPRPKKGAEPWTGLERRGVRSLVVYAEGSTSFDAFETFHAEALRGRTSPALRVEILRGADHTLTPLWAQDRLLELVEGWLCESAPSRARAVEPPVGEEPGHIEPEHVFSGYFGPPGRRLFGIYRRPADDRRRRCCVVLCRPVGEEHIRSHTALLQLGFLLAKSGFHVFHFDYYGCGDSAGDFDEGGLESWVDDVALAADHVRSLTSARDLCLVGLRLGASLCFQAASSLGGVRGVVLWEPVIRGDSYLEELTRSHEEWAQGAFAVTHSAVSSGTTELLGFPFSERLLRDLEGLDLFQEPLPAAEVLVVDGRTRELPRRWARHLADGDLAVEHRWVERVGAWMEDAREVGKGLATIQVLRTISSWAERVCP